MLTAAKEHVVVAKEHVVVAKEHVVVMEQTKVLWRALVKLPAQAREPVLEHPRLMAPVPLLVWRHGQRIAA